MNTMPSHPCPFRRAAIAAVVATALFGNAAVPSLAANRGQETTTPIKHLIVVIGENHTFDNMFGAYKPRRGQTIRNLLSERIINEDGTPGPNFYKAAQQMAADTDHYRVNPLPTGPFAFLPQPVTNDVDPKLSGQPFDAPDGRFPANLPNGPFQITRYVPYSAYLGDPPHRFFQMWQQYDAGKLDLFPWVGITVGIGGDNFFGPPFPVPSPANTIQGGESMGFYNMATGDAPHFKHLARRYAISDNYHQPIMGGTGANFLAIATGDVAFFNKNGAPAKPFDNQVENPDPQKGTNNFYTHDGYTGGSYVNCSDAGQPGVGAIKGFLKSLPYEAFNNGNCAAGTYYLVNNYGLGYTVDGQTKPLAADKFTLPPQTIEYCGICDPFTGFTSVMTTGLKNNLQGMTEFYNDVAGDHTMPAVSFVRPFESKAGHPANATVPDFENFVVDLVDKVKAKKELWRDTAILVTVDEGGGYYDSGYIQPIDFFGDGTRIPLIAVSPHAKRGYVDHTYYDHVSILKFIEKNWGLKPLSQRSRDNLPNPVASHQDPYVPVNRPAIGDLTNLFTFDHNSEEVDRDSDTDD
jgi:phospholipase C